jgi:hypothetical protein
MASVSREALDYKSALAICPPKHTWHGIQNFRWLHDKQVKRWPPHINLLYPFVSTKSGNALADAEQAVSHACRSFQPFSVLIEHTRHFAHNKKSATCWLDPLTEHNELAQLQHTLEAAVPVCNDLRSIGNGSVVHHLSIGQCHPKNTDRLKAEATESICPLSFRVSSVQLLTRSDYHSPFELRRSFALGDHALEENQKPFEGVYDPQLAELRDKVDFEGEWPTPISVPCVALLIGDSALQKLQHMHTSELVQLENCTIQTTEDGKGFEPVQREDKCIEQARLDWVTPKEFARRSAAVKWSDAVSVRARRLSDGSCVNAIALFSRDKRAKQHQADGKCNSKPQP